MTSSAPVKPGKCRHPCWNVTIAAHVVGGRYEIPEQVHAIHAPDKRAAMIDGTRHAHILARTPPWRPLLRETWPHVSAKRASVVTAAYSQGGIVGHAEGSVLAP